MLDIIERTEGTSYRKALVDTGASIEKLRDLADKCVDSLHGRGQQQE